MKKNFKQLVAVMGAAAMSAALLAALFVLCTMFAEDGEVVWWKRLLFAVVLTAVIYLLFHNVLNLKLPTNRLF